jgi:hypothetical protein
MTDDDRPAWLPLFDSTCSRAELAQIIEEQIHISLVSVLEQVATMGMGPRDRIIALALVEPIIRSQTVRALLAGWHQLQSDAAASTIH